MMDKLGVQVGEATPDAVILCMRAEDFDPTSNVLWENEANKSAIRPNVRCFGCKSAVAMSNHTYARYTSMDKKPRVCCVQCVTTLCGS